MGENSKDLESEDEKDSESYLEEENPDYRKSSRFGRFLLGFFDLLKTVVLIVILTYAIRVLVIQPFIVEGQSMESSFHNGDYLITEKLSFRMRSPERGEIVIFHPPDNPTVNYIKRIVGLPGDKITIENGSLYINDKKIIEPYLASNDSTSSPKKEGYSVTLKENEYFVLGDNRNHSRDSREIGPIPKNSIVSRIWFRLLPISQAHAFSTVRYEVSP